MDNYCPNFESCRLVQTRVVVSEEKTRTVYISSYCKNDEDKWTTCKRFITKTKYDLCPDFVLPDSILSPEEILDKFDDEISNN